MKETLDAKNMNLLKLQRYQQHSPQARVKLGTPSWETVKFLGTLYDHQTALEDFLKLYAAQYDTVEYQKSFMGIPSQRRMEALKNEVAKINPDFKFCPLVSRRISHEFELGENPYDVKEFQQAVSCLGEHLGPCILRLPETFAPASLKILMRFLCGWRRDLKLAIHLTNQEWFKKGEALKKLVSHLQGSPFSIVMEDKIQGLMIPEKILTSDHLIVRFFGRPSLNQDEQRLAMWVYKLGEYQGYGVKNPFFILYEQEEMCLSILSKMANSIGGHTRLPRQFDQCANQLSFGL